MKQEILREILHVDENRRLHIDVPEGMGSEFEVIVVPIRPRATAEPLSDEDRFMLAAYAAVTEDDAEEDALWERYKNV